MLSSLCCGKNTTTAERTLGSFRTGRPERGARCSAGLALSRPRSTKQRAAPAAFKVIDAQRAVLTEDGRRVASNIAKLPALLGAAGNPELDDFPEGGG